jgi:hypothetical protein
MQKIAARSCLLGALIIAFGPLVLAQPAAAVFKQQGSKLVGTGSPTNPPPNQGRSVSLSADGSTALVGGNECCG